MYETDTFLLIMPGSEAIYLDDELLNGNGTDSEFTNTGVMIELRVLICLWTSGRYAASFCHNIDS